MLVESAIPSGQERRFDQVKTRTPSLACIDVFLLGEESLITESFFLGVKIIKSFHFSAWLVDFACWLQSFRSFDHIRRSHTEQQVSPVLDRSEVVHLIHMTRIPYLTSWVGCLWVIFSQFRFTIVGVVQGEADCCSTLVILRSTATRKLFHL